MLPSTVGRPSMAGSRPAEVVKATLPKAVAWRNLAAPLIEHLSRGVELIEREPEPLWLVAGQPEALILPTQVVQLSLERSQLGGEPAPARRVVIGQPGEPPAGTRLPRGMHDLPGGKPHLGQRLGPLGVDAGERSQHVKRARS